MTKVTKRGGKSSQINLCLSWKMKVSSGWRGVGIDIERTSIFGGGKNMGGKAYGGLI